MTPDEIVAALSALNAKVGSEAYSAMHIDAFETQPVYVAIYPEGVVRSSSPISIRANTFAEAITAINAAWDKVAADHERATVRAMAIKIIEITADCGDCTDAALRQHFDASEIARLGAQAVEAADGMAANGPFRILATVGANAA